VKFLRFLLTCLVLAIAVVVLLLVAAFAPAVQTWVAQMALARQTGLHATLGSLYAGFSDVEITDLRVEVGGAVLTVPSLQAKLPIMTAVWNRKVLVQSLMAKGWTLDLSRLAAQQDARAEAVSVPKGGGGTGAPAQPRAVPFQKVARPVDGIGRGWKLPCDVSLDGAALEGEVLMAAQSGGTPVRVHVLVKGGGLAAGHEGTFSIDAVGAVGELGVPLDAVLANGRLVVAMDSPRTFKGVEFSGNLSAEGGSFPDDLAVSAGVAATDGGGGEIYTVDFSRGTRHPATFVFSFPAATHRFAGTWKVDLRDSDLKAFCPKRPLPNITATGDGQFDADRALERVHATGRLKGVVDHLGVLAQPLDCLGAVTLDAGFDLSHSAPSIRFDRLSISLGGTSPGTVVQTLQPFNIDERTGDVKVADPRGDWLEGSTRGLPLAWLSGLTNWFTLAGGNAVGDFLVRAADGGFSLRSKTPLTAAGVSVLRSGRTLGQGLDVSLALLFDCDSKGWRMQWAPLTVGSAGRRWATIEAKTSRPVDADQATAITGTWKADLEALASQPAIPGIHWLKGRSASGDFSASVGASMAVDSRVTVLGHDPGHSVTASAHADFDADGQVTFQAPLKIAFGSSVSEVVVKGTWAGDDAAVPVDVKLTGEKVTLEHLGLLAAPLSAASGVLGPEGSTEGKGDRSPPGMRDRVPFWGDWVGRVRFAFDQLRAADHDLSNVSGMFTFDHGSLHLEGGRGVIPNENRAKRAGTTARRRGADTDADVPIPHPSQTTAEGSISFDATAEYPYNLKATATIDQVDAAPLFAAPQSGHEPLVEGHFTIAAILTGNGINLGDLMGRTQEEFHLTSTAGIIRLLKTSVAESIPQVPSPVSEALGNVGSTVGLLLGIERNSLYPSKNPVSKTAEAVLDFTSQVSEIGYDKVTVTAVRGADGAIRLTEIVMNAPAERLTGSGQISCVNGRSLRAQPLSVDLQLSVRGRNAELLSQAGLLSSPKDTQSFATLNQPIHFGGTLEHLDESAWHDLLAKAATKPPEGGKKGN
jgi:hypothetical protein